MKLTSTLAVTLTLALAHPASAQFRRFATWPASPGFSTPTGYASTWPYYGGYGYNMPFNQPHWIYNYTPGSSWGQPATSYQYGAFSSSPAARDYGPPARARASVYPAIPYSEFAAQEQQQSRQGRGYLSVQVPTPDAKVWINDVLMTQTGRERSFMTPVLGSANRDYTFEVKASWTDEHGPRTQQLPNPVSVRAGDTTLVVFPVPAKK